MAKMDKSEIAKALFQLALGMGMGMGSPGGASIALANVGAGFKPGLPAGVDTFLAKNYPTEFSPTPFHTYNVINIPGGANYNQHGKANSEVIDLAGRMQTLDEHNAAIQKYVRPGMNPKQMREALSRGLQEEKNLEAFWNESESRRPFSVSSSAVTGIRLTPDGRIEVQWKGKPTWYTFKQYPDTQAASMAAQELLQADSIGRAVMPFQRKGKLLHFKSPDVGYWNHANYDPAYA